MNERPMRFYVLQGSHIEAGKRYGRGSVVESRINLEERFGSSKFRRLHGNENPQVQLQMQSTIKAMTVAELRKFAESEGIDLGHATRKEEILGIIEAAGYGFVQTD